MASPTATGGHGIVEERPSRDRRAQLPHPLHGLFGLEPAVGIRKSTRMPSVRLEGGRHRGNSPSEHEPGTMRVPMFEPLLGDAGRGE